MIKNLKSVNFYVFVLFCQCFAFDTLSNSTDKEIQRVCDAIHSCNITDFSNSTEVAKCITLKHNTSVSNNNPSNGNGPSSKPSPQEVWTYGLLFVTAISLCSLLGVSVMPLMQKWYYKQLLTALIGLAVGSLSSSALFHLVPQAFSLVNDDAHADYLNISLAIWTGIWAFFMVERFLKIINDARQRSEKTSLHDGEVPLQNVSSLSSPNQNGIYDCQEQAIKASFGHQERPKVTNSYTNIAGEIIKFENGLKKGESRQNVIATVAWMVIFGDGLHNFIDGLSIGAAFNESILTGVSISLAVMCEEFPHELGDFAVLLNAGMTIRQALVYNFLSACTCYIGLCVGITLGEIECSTYIFGFAAGMFLYISLVDMVPEMNEVVEEASKDSVKTALWALVLQNIGIFTGVTALFLLAKYPEYFEFL